MVRLYKVQFKSGFIVESRQTRLRSQVQKNDIQNLSSLTCVVVYSLSHKIQTWPFVLTCSHFEDNASKGQADTD